MAKEKVLEKLAERRHIVPGRRHNVRGSSFQMEG